MRALLLLVSVCLLVAATLPPAAHAGGNDDAWRSAPFLTEHAVRVRLAVRSSPTEPFPLLPRVVAAAAEVPAVACVRAALAGSDPSHNPPRSPIVVLRV